MSINLLRGDARALPLPDESVDLIVASPPYFGLRSYTDGGDVLPCGTSCGYLGAAVQGGDVAG